MLLLKKSFSSGSESSISMKIVSFTFVMDTERKLNVPKTFRRRPGRSVYVLCLQGYRSDNMESTKLDFHF